MKKEMSHISVYQTSKVIAMMHFVITAVFCIPIGLLAFFASSEPGKLLLLLLPIGYAFFSFVMVAALSWMYNLVAGIFGGIEVTWVDKL